MSPLDFNLSPYADRIKTAKTTDDAKLLNLASEDIYAGVRSAVIQNPRVPLEILQRMESGDRDRGIRLAAGTAIARKLRKQNGQQHLKKFDHDGGNSGHLG